MGPIEEKEDLVTRKIIGKAIAIHRELGPGLLESVYEYFLAHELRKAGFFVEQQKAIPVEYGGERIDLGFRPDLIINGEVIVEIKTVQKLAPIHEAQLLSYLKLAEIERGLLINFHSLRLADGIKRLSLTRRAVPAVPAVPLFPAVPPNLFPQFLGAFGGLGG
jgi:hypothetical protein